MRDKGMETNNKNEQNEALDRRKFIAKTILAGAGMAVITALPGDGSAQKIQQGKTPAGANRPGFRKLGTLEVSSVGLGVQNMSRTYQTTIPSRAEMINIIRTAFDRGVTFFDAAEAYGPFEVERILGEGVAPFRDKVVITSKFGWNIDLDTG